MKTLIVLGLVTVFYAAYNLLVKVSSGHAGSATTPPVLATITLQLSALTLSTTYLFYLIQKGQSVAISPRAIPWAIAAGLCIGMAEVLYFVLFRGVAGEPVISASRAIPIIVGGTIAITVVVAGLALGERLSAIEWCGVGLTIVGMLVLAFGGGAD